LQNIHGRPEGEVVVVVTSDVGVLFECDLRVALQLKVSDYGTYMVDQKGR
jgi:hypothetical protein